MRIDLFTAWRIIIQTVKKMPKTPVKEQDASERSGNFSEVCLGYTREEAVLEAERCVECGKCVPGCPVGIDIPGFIHAIKEGDFGGACEIIKRDNMLPAVCGRVCPQENQCEKECVLGVNDEPVAIGRLERFAAEHDAGAAVDFEGGGKKVAVIGSGPAGLTCAAILAGRGHEATILEALHKPGGVLEYGIPSFRLPRDVLEKEIEYVKSRGVSIECNTVAGLSPTSSELLMGYDAVFISTGAGLPYFLGVAGENLSGVYSANEYLIRVNMMHAGRDGRYDTPIIKGRRVAVVGGGNVAMDCVRSALRLGADKAMIIYRRGMDELPARKEEVEHAVEEGIDFMILANPVRFIGREGKVDGIECVKMRLGEPDESGRRRPVPIEGSEHVVGVDVVVVAIGQGPNPLLLERFEGLELTERGRIKVDEKQMTSIKGVFAGGDISSNESTVIAAMGQGKRAAESINKYLKTI